MELETLRSDMIAAMKAKDKASISGYINNIVNEHLEKCKPEIIKLYKEKKADYGN